MNDELDRALSTLTDYLTRAGEEEAKAETATNIPLRRAEHLGAGFALNLALEFVQVVRKEFHPSEPAAPAPEAGEPR